MTGGVAGPNSHKSSVGETLPGLCWWQDVHSSSQLEGAGSHGLVRGTEGDTHNSIAQVNAMKEWGGGIPREMN